MKPFLFAIIAGLAGCTGIDQKVGTIAVADLQQASDDAALNNDTVATACYAKLIPLAKKLADPASEAKGLFMAVQKQRDVLRAGLDASCGPLAIDFMMMAKQFGP